MLEAELRERRRGRRWAMKALYMWDARGGGEARALVDEAIRMEAVPAEREAERRGEGVGRERVSAEEAEAPVRSGAGAGQAGRFAHALVVGAIAHADVIDALLENLAPAWGPGRMAAVDRALLRLGCYELMYEDTPEAVAVSDTVELARAYSTADSPRFVNGVLGAVAPRRGGGAPKAGRPGRAKASAGPASPPAVRRRGEPG